MSAADCVVNFSCVRILDLSVAQHCEAQRSYSRDEVQAFVLSSSVLAAAFFLVCIAGALRAVIKHRSTKLRSRTLLVRGTHLPPSLKMPSQCKWHLFLSHTWAFGQDQVHRIKAGLRGCVRGMHIFLDVDVRTCGPN